MAFDFDEFTKKVNKKYPYWKKISYGIKKNQRLFISIHSYSRLCCSMLFTFCIMGNRICFVAFNRIWLELDYTVRDLRHGLGLRER